MKAHASMIAGPTLYRHECRQCAADTLHNARGCIRCETSPWTKPIRLKGYAHRVLTTKARTKNW